MAVAHDFWAAYNQHDVAALDRVLDDQLHFVSIMGTVSNKAEFLEPFRKPPGPVKSESDEEPEDVRVLVEGDTAIISFNRRWTVTFTAAKVRSTGKSRMTETLQCRAGRWRVIAFQETLLPNATRPAYEQAAAEYDSYVGIYRFGDNGDGAEIRVTRDGGKLFEAWGADPPGELIPARHDTFFMRGFPWTERFLRDRNENVIGIHYMLEDGEIVAKRVP